MWEAAIAMYLYSRRHLVHLYLADDIKIVSAL
jgi:hypothetical protein